MENRMEVLPRTKEIYKDNLSCKLLIFFFLFIFNRNKRLKKRTFKRKHFYDPFTRLEWLSFMTC